MRGRSESDQEQWNLCDLHKDGASEWNTELDVGPPNIYLDKNFSRDDKFYRFTSISSFHLTS